MSDHLVGRAWLAEVETTAQRALLGSLAWLADHHGVTVTTAPEVAAAAGMSVRSAQSHLRTLVEHEWIQVCHVRSIDGRRHGGTRFELAPGFLPKECHPAILTASHLPGDRKSTVLPFAADRVGPAWAWRVPIDNTAGRVVLGTMALLSDHRGVCLAPRTTIADRSLLSRRSTDRVLRELEDQGWVGREPRRRGQRAAEARLCLTRQFLTAAARPAGITPPAAAPIAPPASAASGGLLVERDHEDLAGMIADAVEAGWGGPAADRLAEAVMVWLTTRAGRLIRRRVAFGTSDSIADTATIAWQVLREHSGDILAARSPWGLLATIVAARSAREDETARGVVDLGKAGKLQGFGLADDWELDQAPAARDEQLRGKTLGLDDIADAPVMDVIVTQLARLGVDPGLSWPVLCRCVEISLHTSQSRRHTAARNDYQLELLGLTPDAAAAWMNLITGTRRAGQTVSALLQAGIPLVEAVPADWLANITTA